QDPSTQFRQKQPLSRLLALLPGNSIVVTNNSVTGFAVDGVLVTEPDLFLSSQILPWQGLKAGTKKQKYYVISEKKVSTHIEVKKQLDNHWSTSIFSDIRELFSLEDVMEEVGLGPNDALMYCMEYLDDSLHDWVDEELDNYDDYLIFDCPGASMTI
ncbi:unnamed protein product, partial [Brassica oleracea]